MKEAKTPKGLDLIRQKMREIESRRRKFWQPAVGPNLIRILPGKDDDPFFIEAKQHFIPWGGERGKGTVLLCLEATGQECKACREAERLVDSDSVDDQNLGKKIRANSRYLYNIVDLKHPEQGVQVWSSFSDNVLGELCGYYADPECGDFTDPEGGRNVEISKEDRGKAPPHYDVKVKMAASKLANKEWLKDRKDLKRLVPTASPSEMKQVMSHSTGVPGEDEDPALSLPCFGKEYNKLPSCPQCPVRARCKVIYRSTRSEQLKQSAIRTLRIRKEQVGG